MGGSMEILQYCIAQGVDILKPCDDGSTLLHWAATGGNIAMFKFLESRGMDWNQADKDGTPPLFWAATGNKPEMVKYLVEEKHADVNFRDHTGNFPLRAAVQGGSYEITQYLLSHGADLNAPLNDHQTLLLIASEANNPELLKQLIEKGGDVNAMDDHGATPLLVATAHGNINTIQVLLENGAKTNPGLCTRKSCTNTGATPLHSAAWRFPSIVEYLISKGADVNARNLDGNTPMHNAAIGDSIRSISILWKNGGLVDVANNDGMTPLMRAVRAGKEDAVRELIACNANVALADNDGRTALHYAAISGSGKMVSFLLESGADLRVKDRKGHTANWYALYYGNQTTAATLQTAGAPREKTPDRANLVSDVIPEGEAVVWYLNHSGWAVRTSHHLLVFDYWHRTPPSDNPCLDNGRIIPEEIADKNVVVFVSHSHLDHFMPDIAQWSSGHKNISYILGFEGSFNAAYTYISPGQSKEVDGVMVRTIRSTDTGEGFMVEADGVTIFHPGDHACRYEESDTAFSNEIDALAKLYKNIDIAFVPVTGCNFNNKSALEKGNDYLVSRFTPRVVFPMHGSGNEQMFQEYAIRKNKESKTAVYKYALFTGDRFVVPAKRKDEANFRK